MLGVFRSYSPVLLSTHSLKVHKLPHLNSHITAPVAEQFITPTVTAHGVKHFPLRITYKGNDVILNWI